jgi:hypothetical protein
MFGDRGWMFDVFIRLMISLHSPPPFLPFAFVKTHLNPVITLNRFAETAMRFEDHKLFVPVFTHAPPRNSRRENEPS